MDTHTGAETAAQRAAAIWAYGVIARGMAAAAAWAEGTGWDVDPVDLAAERAARLARDLAAVEAIEFVSVSWTQLALF